MMHLTKCIIKVVARVVNSCYLLAERVGPQFHRSSKLTIVALFTQCYDDDDDDDD